MSRVASRQAGTTRAARTIVKRCQGVHRTRPATFRSATMTCCRRSAFSATSSARRRVRSTASPKTNRRRSITCRVLHRRRAGGICSQDGDEGGGPATEPRLFVLHLKRELDARLAEGRSRDRAQRSGPRAGWSSRSTRATGGLAAPAILDLDARLHLGVSSNPWARTSPTWPSVQRMRPASSMPSAVRSTSGDCATVFRSMIAFFA